MTNQESSVDNLVLAISYLIKGIDERQIAEEARADEREIAREKRQEAREDKLRKLHDEAMAKMRGQDIGRLGEG
jgi:hypothetical protein